MSLYVRLARVHVSYRTDSAAGIKENNLLVTVVAIYWVAAILGPWNPLGASAVTVNYVQGVILLVFVFMHGVRRYGWDTMLMWLGITALISWSAESLGVSAAIPFGNYHYTELLGFKIGAVPLTIMAAYFTTGYLAWTMATIFLGDLGTGIKKRNLALVPVVAGFIMVMWDFCFDPIKSTIEGYWIWEDGGAYHGVPLSNFAGWFVTVFLIFIVFALYLHRYGISKRLNQSKVYWVLAPVMYLGLALEYLLYPFSETSHLDIYWSMFIAAIFTMVFVSLLNIIFVSRIDEDWRS